MGNGWSKEEVQENVLNSMKDDCEIGNHIDHWSVMLYPIVRQCLKSDENPNFWNATENNKLSSGDMQLANKL